MLKKLLRDLSLLALILLLLAAVGGVAVFAFSAPLLRYALREMGYDYITFESFRPEAGRVVFGNVALNRDGIQAKAPSVTYNFRTHRLILEDLSAQFGEEDEVHDVDADIILAETTPPVFARQIFTVGALQAGLPLTDGRLEISLNDAGTVIVHKSEWTLAKGRLETSSFSFTPPQPLMANITVTAHGLDLAELFRITPIEGFDITGKVDGKIPLVIREDTAQIRDAVLKTREPGTIRYAPKTLPAFMQGDAHKQILDLRTALTAFDYEELQLILNGEIGKTQKISLKAKGKNPGFYQGHPVSINFNIEGPLQSVIQKTPLSGANLE